MNITDLLDEYRIPYHSEGRGTRPGWINMRCVFCEKDPYLGYNLAGRYFNCWNCGPKYLPLTIQLLTGLEPAEIYKIIGDLPREHYTWEVKERKNQALQMPDGLNFGPLHREYLKNRGFDPFAVLVQWKINGIGPHGGNLKWRLFIPVFLRGEMVSWTTRAIGKSQQPRYWSATDEQSILPITSLIYGVDACRNAIILCEGPIDAWAIGSGAAALCGLRVSPAQMDQLSKFPVRVVCFDSEPVAQERAKKLCEDLSIFEGRTVNITLESGKDAAAAKKEEILALREDYLTWQ